jgi:hypothetical protein
LFDGFENIKRGIRSQMECGRQGWAGDLRLNSRTPASGACACNSLYCSFFRGRIVEDKAEGNGIAAYQCAEFFKQFLSNLFSPTN